MAIEEAEARRIDIGRGALLLVLAIAAGAAMSAVGLPLAWMIGPMLVAAGLAVAGYRVCLPRQTRPAGQIIVACAVGLYLTSEALVQIVTLLPEILVIAVGTGGVACAMAPLLLRLSRADPATAFFACVPCGPAEMAQLAEQGGGSGPLVGLAQSLRIALVVLIIPAALQIGGGGTAVAVPEAHGLLAFGALTLPALALALAAALLARRIGMVSPYFLGPLTVSAAIAVTGPTLIEFPRLLVFCGQLLVGLSLGLSFDRDLLRAAPRFILSSAGVTLVTMALCALMAWAIAAVDSLPVPTMILASAPGSVTEMSLTAEAMGLGVAMVTTFHVVRLLIILPLSPLALRLILRGPVA